MKVVYAKHEPYEDGHLGEVALDMEHHGQPTIRVMEFDGKLCALEGSHRLAVAHHMGIEPKLVVMEPESSSDTDSWWGQVLKTLPRYVFPTAHVLRLDAFDKKKNT